MNALQGSQMREERQKHQHQPRRKTPSFSSSLLDAIYRSIDESKCKEDEVEADDSAVLHRGTTSIITTRTKKQRNFNVLEDEETLRRAIMIEKWMENENHRNHGGSRNSRPYNSTSSSSESSCVGVFSSSETETGYGNRLKPTSFTVQRPKQVRSGVSAKPDLQTPKGEASLMRTKSKALKIYGDLKNVKQPISPGRRITNFLNSLFNSRNMKSAKRETMEDLSSVRKARSVKNSTACSLPSSFSRSCLSKPPPSRAKLGRNNCSKRSDNVDEDRRPSGHKCIYEGDPSLMPTPTVRKIGETRMLKKMSGRELGVFQEDDEEDDDDLFELENIGAIGIGTYREELPVYGTTSLKTHHAIANSLFLL